MECLAHVRIELWLILFLLGFLAVLRVFLETDWFLLVFDFLTQLGVGLDHLDREVENGFLGVAA